MAEDIPTTIGELVARAGNRWPDRPALVQGSRRTSFGEADALSNRVAGALVKRGIGKGDRIAYLGKNSEELFFVFWGAAKLGAVFVPLNWRLAPNELAEIVIDAEPIILFVDAELADAVGNPAGLREVIRLGSGESGGTVAAWASEAPANAPDVRISPDDVVLQLYTSGTTGRPKGAMLTGDSLIHVRTHQPPGTLWSSWQDDEVILLSMPLFHIGGIGLSINGLAYGATMHVLHEFNAAEFLRHIAEEGVTRLFIVPAALKLLLDQPGVRDIDYSRLRCISYGSSPISLDLLRECVETFGCGFAQNYGMTETCGTVLMLPPEDHRVEGGPHMLSAGRALEGVEAAIMAPDGRMLAPGETGEIVVRARAVMKGYWRLPEATRDAIDAQGWMHTGDAGHIDADGYIYISSRLKDMIISGGENIYPAEIERAITEHSDVADAVVFGVPDPKWGEAVRAVLVLEKGAALAEGDLVAWLRTRLAGYKIPKSFGFLDSLPRNTVGKVMRRELRAPFWAGREREID